MTRARVPPAVFAVTLVLLAGCGDDDRAGQGTAGSAQRSERTAQDGGALGGGARTQTLARQDGVTVPEGEVAWVAKQLRLAAGEELEHEHAFSTVYAHEGDHLLTTPDGEKRLAAGDGAAVAAGVAHTHAAPRDGASVFWDVLLAEPGAELPGDADAETVFESEPLEGIPDDPAVQFIEVVLPPGTETSVHTHPGPEFIYGIQERFDYQNAIEGAREFGPGDQAGIPPDTAVQKRNPEGGDAVFLSWFVVDPDQPFAPGAEFDGS
jgi:quercetin dioxygenase-like cupin family protein